MAPCVSSEPPASDSDEATSTTAWTAPHELVDEDVDAQLLKQHILHSPYVNEDSPAIAVALTSLETVEKEDRLVSQSLPPTKQRKGLVIFGTLLRVLLLDSSVFIVIGLCMTLSWVHYVHDNYLVKQIESAEWNQDETSMTYYTRPCFKSDLSTTNAADLFLSDDATPEDAYQHQLKHGFTVFPGVLGDETAANLRSFIDSRNRNLTEAESNYVIANENRYSFGLGTEVPEVAKAMTEITTNHRLKASIEKIMGPNPALIEMTAITSSYGAVAQEWHDDVVPEASAVQFARSFGPSYSIFVQLQNTTKGMGATDACPGTHMCAAGPLDQVCQDHGIQLVGEHGYWRSGDALLMNMNSWHRGAAHVDRDAPDRVMLILTFVPQPRTHAESRQMAQGITFSLRWDMWGHTWNDLSNAATVMKQPWATLRALGLYKDPSADWGVDYISGASMRIANEDNGFRRDELIDFVKRDGGFPFLPKWLHGHVADDMSTTWHGFLLDTLGLCETFMKYVAIGVLGVYLGLYLLISFISIGLGSGIKQGMIRLGKALFRLGAILSIVLALYKVAIVRVDNTQWASDLRHGLRYTSPFGDEEARFDGPTTFPHRNDVLIETRLKSDFLAMYNDYIGNHPGNRYWNELVSEKIVTFASYSELPTRFRTAVAEYIVGSIYSAAGRFLYQDEGTDFVELNERDAVLYTYNELTVKSDRIRAKVVTQLEYLISEAKYGHLRESIMSMEYTIPFLVILQQRLLGSPPKSKRSNNPLARPASRSTDRSLTRAFQHSQMAQLPSLQTMVKRSLKRPVKLVVGTFEPSPHSYLTAGEIVEAKVPTKRGKRWQRAVIEDVWSTGYLSVYVPGIGKRVELHRLDIRQLHDDGDEGQ